MIILAKDKLGGLAAELISKDLNIAGWDGKKGCCPFHKENTPSLIWCEEDKSGGRYYFKCFGCGVTYDIISHFMQFDGLSFNKAVQKLCEMADVDFANPKSKNDIDIKKYRFPKDNSINSTTNVSAYLKKRSISEQTLIYAGIKEDNNRNIIFEYRDIDDTLFNVKCRPAKPIQKGQPKMWFQSDADNCPLIFNMQKIDITKPLIITEGEIDCLSVIESGITNVGSIPYGANDTKWVEYNFDWLEQFEKIILWFDDDTPGKKAINEVIPRLGRHRTYYVSPTDDVKEVLKQAVLDKKIVVDKCDANNVLIACGKHAVQNLISCAKDMPSKRLKYLMDAKELDPQNMTKITTGYKELDKKIYGNFLPCFNIITGYTGAGKSTVSTQMSIISPIESGYNTMVFSGELHEGQLKSWVLKPLAGRNHVVVWKNPNQPDGYSVTLQAAKAIEDYYHDNMILYTDVDDLEASSKSLLDEMEYSYKRYNTRFFLIDNLMCVDIESVGKNENTEWDSQKRFIKQLMKFTNKYEVNTTLIIHPKKPSQGKERNAYELHGASEIGNLCHRLFWVLQLKDDEEGYNAAIELLKDRTAAKQGSVCKFYYDYPTMRLYSNDEELHRKYSWENSTPINYPKEIIGRIVSNIRDETEEVFGNSSSSCSQ
jgi:twinkle protein